jgi:hypothetical protein
MRLINNLGKGGKSKGFNEKSEHKSIILLDHAVPTHKLLLLLYFCMTSQKAMDIVYIMNNRKHALGQFDSVRLVLIKLDIFGQ